MVMFILYYLYSNITQDKCAGRDTHFRKYFCFLMSAACAGQFIELFIENGKSEGREGLI